ncbi:class I SAM-dependent methyltransferase [Parasulfitobacter algicola]|uniref:SAM-dependent methyltransferase n=1 Tax=Parasulfitobacter algicola TaxID=2614809 RepID=A0ABX2IVV0_9RHOB|nr:SAM-dependent methyltransferase [Sulfitobacter algicola]NSX56126.1 SAM-dependent methyltransferase [Sulfitobacter algicola]
MTLQKHLLSRISAFGPMTIADYMSECLLHPTYGYYTTRDPLGTSGDFTTAPEISQMFGELIGLCLAQSWLDQGAPSPFALIELGPGRGTLMHDILRATTKVPGFSAAVQIHLIEASPVLQDIQREKLGQVHWHNTLQTLPAMPGFFIANEFFDALPIRQFVRSGEGWCERCVTAVDSVLQYALSPATPYDILTHRLDDTKNDDLVEICPQGADIASQIGHYINTHGGAALIVDYGEWRSLGDTFQALQNHQAVNPLTKPGHADLSAHVDFEALAKATPSAHTRLTPQGIFLERLGITQRAQVLANALQGSDLENHVTAHQRLTHPEEMGTLFKVLGFHPISEKPLAGLTI